MAAEPTLEPIITPEEELDEIDEGEESDVYEVLRYSLPHQARDDLFLLTSGTVG
jgi:hypothetical protein